MLDIQEIKKRIHHRFPFLLIDRVLELEEKVSCTAIKNVSINEPIFQGHFPDKAIFPGVLIVEAMAQTAGIASYELNPEGKLAFFAGFDNVKFKSPVTPGDQMILKAEIVKSRRNISFVRGEAFVEGKLVASADLKLAIID